MRVFIGCLDIASILSGVVEGFKEAGHDVTSFVFEKNKFYPDFKYDIIKEPFLQSKLNYQQKNFPNIIKALLLKIDAVIQDRQLSSLTDSLIESHDLFIFIWKSWLPEEQLFPRIKKAGKKIVCLHVGSDVRHISAFKQEFSGDVSLWEEFFHTEDLNEKIKKVRIHELYADAIFSVPDQEGLAIRGFNHLHIPLKSIENIKFLINDKEIPIVVHAPSRTGIKGTDLIVTALTKLKEEGFKFEFRLLKDLSNSELLEELTNADILVDEVLLHGPGVLSFEAMLAGTIVATRTIDGYKDIFDPPVINITPDSVYDKLRDILLNLSSYKKNLKRNKEYVEKYNSPNKVASDILKSLENSITEYRANFFLNRYILPEGASLTDEVLELNRKVIAKCMINDPRIIENAVRGKLLKPDNATD